MGKSIYSEFQKSPENIPTNILAERLKRLDKHGIIEKTQYQERPIRYAYGLTDKGKALWPVMKAIMQWGNDFIPETYDTREMLKRIESGES